jgi:hypothetical protein
MGSFIGAAIFHANVDGERPRRWWSMLITAQASPGGGALVHFGAIEVQFPFSLHILPVGLLGGGLFPFRRQKKPTRRGGDVWMAV